MKGKLYGTTYGGGNDTAYAKGLGIVFRVTQAGAEGVLHRFVGSPDDGAWPQAGLIDVAGTLYSTTLAGGLITGRFHDGAGTVFSITRSGVEHVVYAFKGGADGGFPYASLLDVNGVLYGTTANGGVRGKCGGPGCGTVFRVTTNGSESVLHRFGSKRDGRQPYASLLYANGLLYGTTTGGGAFGYGTVFSVDPTTSVERVLYSFKGMRGNDGAYPASALVAVRGTLYGTTVAGGGSSECRPGCGVVFSLTTGGDEHVLYRFVCSGTYCRGGDGVEPSSGLAAIGGMLYGTTSAGGTNGTGTVYAVSTTGSEYLVHSFGSAADGDAPSGGVIDLQGTLYGVTARGPASASGIVYAVTPAPTIGQLVRRDARP